MIHSDKSISIFGLLVACPYGAPLDDCPLEKYRHRPIKEMLKTVENFTSEEIDSILKHHNFCTLSRV